jgi:hypothetical protein
LPITVASRNPESSPPFLTVRPQRLIIDEHFQLPPKLTPRDLRSDSRVDFPVGRTGMPAQILQNQFPQSMRLQSCQRRLGGKLQCAQNDRVNKVPGTLGRPVWRTISQVSSRSSHPATALAFGNSRTVADCRAVSPSCWTRNAQGNSFPLSRRQRLVGFREEINDLLPARRT